MRQLVYSLLILLVILPTTLTAQKLIKTEVVTENGQAKKDAENMRWKLYQYDDGTNAAFTMNNQRITPKVDVRPYYCGGGLFKVYSDSTTSNGERIIVAYNTKGESHGTGKQIKSKMVYE